MAGIGLESRMKEMVGIPPFRHRASVRLDALLLPGGPGF
jgi:hypothetical protein